MNSIATKSFTCLESVSGSPTPQTDEGFGFKYIPVEDFERVVKSVKDKHKRRDQEALWHNFFAPPTDVDLPPSGSNHHSAGAVPCFSEQYIDSLVNDAVGEVIENMGPLNLDGDQPLVTEANRLEIEPKVTKRKKRKGGQTKTQYIECGMDILRGDRVQDDGKENHDVVLNIFEEQVATVPEVVIPIDDEPIPTIMSARNLVTNEEHQTNKDVVPITARSQTSRKLKAEADEIIEAEVFLTKITTYQEKMCLAIREIGIKVADGSTSDCSFDVKRFKKRFCEFIIRFNRNYLYQIGRTMDEIKVFRSKDVLTSSPKYQLTQKVCSLFAMLQQACHSFARNMAGDIGLDKLHIFLDTVVDALHVCLEQQVFEKNDLLIKRLLVKTTTLMDCIDEKLCIDQADIYVPQPLKKSTRNAPKFNQPNTKYSMYGNYNNMTLPRPSYGRSGPKQTRKNEIRSLAKRSSKTRVIGQAAVESSTSIRQKGCNVKRSNADVRTVVGDTDWNEPDCEPAMSNTSMVDTSGHFCDFVPDTNTKPIDSQNCLIKALQSITQQHIKQILAPLMEQLNMQKNPESVQRQIAALYASVCPTTERDAGCLKTGVSAAAAAADIEHPPNHIDRFDNCPNHVDGVAAAVAAVDGLAGHMRVDDESTTAPSFRLELKPRANRDQPQVVAPSADRLTTTEATTPKHAPRHPGPVTNIRFCRNVQHTYVVEAEPPPPTATDNKVAVSNAKTITEVTTDERRKKGETAALARARDHRKRFMKSVSRNPLYLNENFNNNPWELISSVADETVRTAIAGVEDEFDFGEEDIVKAFIEANRTMRPATSTRET